MTAPQTITGARAALRVSTARQAEHDVSIPDQRRQGEGWCAARGLIRTGKGGQYRYYAGSTKARQGPTACTGMTVPMEKLDDLIAKNLEDELLRPDRLETILSAVLDRRQEQTTRKRAYVAELNKRATETDLRLKRHYDANENADVDDPDLKDRIATLKATRDQAKADAERVAASLSAEGRKAVARPMLATSPAPRASGCEMRMAAIAAITSARWRKEWKSLPMKFGFSALKAICCKR